MAGLKKIENRSWRTSFRGRLLIHAGKSRRWLCDTLPDGSPVPHDHLVFGAILGFVRVTDCVLVEKVKSDPWAEGPWCWILTDPEPLAVPIPYRGAQLLFEVPDHVLHQHPAAALKAAPVLFPHP